MTTKKYRGGRRSGGIDWIILVSYLSLVGIGLLMIYTTTYYDQSDIGMWTLSSDFGRQCAWALLSLVVLVIFTMIDWQVWNSFSAPLYVLGILLLIALLFFGTEIKGAKSWFHLGPWSLQPSEFAKLSTALYVASLLSSVQTKLTEYRSQLIMAGVMIAPILLIILQPDPGSALTFLSLMILYYRFGMPNLYYLMIFSIFLTIVFSLTNGFYIVSGTIALVTILLTARYQRKYIYEIMALILLVLSNVLLIQFKLYNYLLGLNVIYLLAYLILVNRKRKTISIYPPIGGVMILSLISFSSTYAFENVLKPHQQDRIKVWLQPDQSDPQEALYNLNHSKLAIGSGGIQGKGYLKGTFTKFNYVPEQTTDFIFSSIGEEQGFIGGISVIAIFLILVIRILNIGESSNYNFVAAFCYAIGGFVFIHFFINIGMTMGLSPVIGIPLPLISKGGSALLSFSMMIGIVLNMSKEK